MRRSVSSFGGSVGRALRDAARSPRLKRALYDAGALTALHRLRNRRALTVIMFHRVLAPADPRWATCDPEYSLADAVFADCLAFFRRHYHVVSADDVLAARAGERPLPERPLLITFDDGWSDNEEFALGHLRRAGLPALLFVVSDAIDRAEPFFQEQLVNAWRAGRLDAAGCAALWRATGGDPAAAPRFAAPPSGRDVVSEAELAPLRALITRLESLGRSARAQALASVAAALRDGVRYMITTAQLRRLADGGVAIGSHGKSHTPLAGGPDPVDLATELAGSRVALGDRLGSRLGGADAAPATLSFPHGRFDADVVRQAHAAGYRLLFTSVPELNPIGADGRIPAVLGRVGFTTATVTDDHGRFSPAALALHLFRKPHAAAR